MIYKILIVKNSYTKKVTLTKYLTDWFKKYTPLEITIDEISTNFPVTSVMIGNSTYKGIICNSEILPKLRTVIPENKYNAVILYADNLSGGIRVSVCNGENRQAFLYPNTELIQLSKVNDNGKVSNHELFHAFFAKANRIGIQIEDNLDTYINNNDLVIDDKIDTNREVALLKLTPYWSSICAFQTQTMHIPPKTMHIPPKTMENRWKYFKLTEKTGTLGHTIADLKPELVDLIDKMRGECGFSWIITSGYRTVEENNLLPNSVTDSAHTTREAVDIYCVDDRKRQILLDVVRKNGINRIGIGKIFIHIDISKTLAQNVTWVYN